MSTEQDARRNPHQTSYDIPFERLEDLKPFAFEQHLDKGFQLRVRGHHYDDLFLLIRGELLIEFDEELGKESISRFAGPVGEIGFLYGIPATTTVTTLTDSETLHFDDAALSRMERENPELSTSFLRYLAKTASGRPNNGLVNFDSSYTIGSGTKINTVLCRDESMLHRAQRLRYDVYCLELGRSSPYANHDESILRDQLDDHGYVFLARKANNSIGTLRLNFSSKGNLGILTDLYRMKDSPYYPNECGICTKFIISKSSRGGNAAISLIAAAADFGLRQGIKECYIDCVPGLLHYYQAMGFRVSGEQFFHRENGPSIPMKIDLVRHGKKLCIGDSKLNMLRLLFKAKYFKFVNRYFGTNGT